MKVSIIIVNYNTRELLKNCLTSLYQFISGIKYEIIVVDNASEDDSVKMVQSEFKDCIIIESKKNVGFGGANNIGALNATGEYLFLLNSDTEFIDDALTTLVSFMESHPDCGICGGNLIDKAKLPIHSYGPVLPSPWSDLHRFCNCSMTLRYGKNWCYNYTGKPKKVGYITGADLLIKKNLFDELKGFDPDFFMYYEETELTYRVKKAGWNVYSVPEATIVHIKGASLEFLEGSNKIAFESKYRYLLKVYGKRGAIIAHFIFRTWCAYKQIAFTILRKKSRLEKYNQMIKIETESYYKEIRK